MTPHQRNVLHVKDAIRFMTDSDVSAAARDRSLPDWARAIYAAELATRFAAVHEANREHRPYSVVIHSAHTRAWVQLAEVDFA